MANDDILHGLDLFWNGQPTALHGQLTGALSRNFQGHIHHDACQFRSPPFSRSNQRILLNFEFPLALERVHVCAEAKAVYGLYITETG